MAVMLNISIAFSLALKIPNWCKKWSLKINGHETQEYDINKGNEGLLPFILKKDGGEYLCSF